jgi:4-amino-4-deoxy-L-arabinose transferase-like glycosyltransferase
MKWIVVWGLSACTAAALAAVFAGAKNRDYSYWIAWCFIFPPLVFWLMLMPANKGPRPRQRSLDDIDRRNDT